MSDPEKHLPRPPLLTSTLHGRDSTSVFMDVIERQNEDNSTIEELRKKVEALEQKLYTAKTMGTDDDLQAFLKQKRSNQLNKPVEERVPVDLSKVHLMSKDGQPFIMLDDGRVLHGVSKATFEIEAGKIPVLKLEVHWLEGTSTPPTKEMEVTVMVDEKSAIEQLEDRGYSVTLNDKDIDRELHQTDGQSEDPGPKLPSPE